MQTAKVIHLSILAAILKELDRAKASGDLVETWWALDDLAGRALRAPGWHERVHAARELEKHRAEYRTEECTDRFGDLAIIWGLPEGGDRCGKDGDVTDSSDAGDLRE